MSNNIDNLFKRTLQNQQCVPPARVWGNIEKHLIQRKRLRGLWWYRSVAAAALIVASVSLWQLFQQKTLPEINETPLSGITLPIQTENTEKAEQTEETHENTAIKSYQPDADTPATPTSFSGLEIAPVTIRQSHRMVGVNNSSVVPKLKTSTIRTQIIPITSGEALKNNQQYLALLNENSREEKVKDKVRFALSGHFQPGYSSGNYSSSVQSTRGYSYSKDQMDGMMNAGGGLKLTVSTGKRLSIQTGVLYSRLGQTTTETSSPVRTAAFAPSTGAPRMATPLGNVKTQRKPVAYRSSEAIVLNSMAANAEESLEQVFGTLEIPLFVRYKLNNNKISFSILGGFSGNFIVDNKVYLKTAEDKELLGSTEDIRNFNMSTDLGLGVEYPVSRKVKIMIEPGFKYYLQSLSRNELIDFKPYMFTLSTGIGIEF